MESCVTSQEAEVLVGGRVVRGRLHEDSGFLFSWALEAVTCLPTISAEFA